MALLSSDNVSKIWKDYMNRISADREAIGLNKINLRAAITAIDSWVENNQASFNSALPIGARTALTAKQKATLLMYVINKRFEVI